MEFSLSLEYFLFTLSTSFTTLQIVASLKNKVGLRILKNRAITIVLASILIVASFLWFFSIRDRNVQTHMEGAQLSLIFGLGAIGSVLVTKFLKIIYESNRT